MSLTGNIYSICYPYFLLTKNSKKKRNTFQARDCNSTLSSASKSISLFISYRESATTASSDRMAIPIFLIFMLRLSLIFPNHICFLMFTQLFSEKIFSICICCLDCSAYGLWCYFKWHIVKCVVLCTGCCCNCHQFFICNFCDTKFF